MQKGNGARSKTDREKRKTERKGESDKTVGLENEEIRERIKSEVQTEMTVFLL